MIAIALLTGGISSIGLACTDMSRYLLITVKCNISSYYSSIFEVTTYVTTDILRLIFFLQFSWDAGFKSSLLGSNILSSTKKKMRFRLLIALVSGLFFTAAIWLTVGSATLGRLRDEIFVNNCDEVIVDDKIAIADAHATVESFSFFSTIIICFYSVKIFYNSKCKWKEGTDNMTISKWILKPVILRPRSGRECVNPDDTGTESRIGELLEDKSYHLYNNYIEVGRKTSLERNALKRWFVVMYFVYLLFVLIHIVHIMKIISLGSHENILDITSKIMNILLHFAAFLFPYYMGVTLNNAHHSYHKKIIDTYFGVEIVVNGAHYLCKPGNYIKCLLHAYEEGPTENTPLVQSIDKFQDVDDSSTRIEVEKKYKEYFKEALRVQTSVITTKVAEFDFIPSFLSISIPFDSHGYTIAVLLTIISIVFKFLQ